MIDYIVKMILKEAKKKNIEHPSMELYELLREINNKVWELTSKQFYNKKRKEHDR